MMPYYTRCPDCGSYLDPGETCECKKPAPSAATDGAEPEKSVSTYKIAEKTELVKEDDMGGLTCDLCGAAIRPGDKYTRLVDESYCAYCLEQMTLQELLRSLGFSLLTAGEDEQ